ncbi:MAG: molybdopterin-dependent oxidoreductase [Candidatus Adiutrix sp.]|nr:molybdopterin-dependent oxidoreductase [Candidatus Adiutrix sp.]
MKAKIPGPDTGIEIKKSICAICDPATQCGLDVFVRDGRVIKVEGSEEHPFNRGSLCAKGAAHRQYLYHPDRIKTPLLRAGPRGSGRFEPVSWSEALNLTAEKLLQAKEKFGPESVVFFSGYTKYPRPFLRRLAHAFGSPNYCTESSTCNTATAMAQKLLFGRPGSPDLPNSQCALIWSCNYFHSNHGQAMALQRELDRGLKMIVVDPRLTPTTAKASLHLRLRPGADGALALAMARVIINEGLFDRRFVEDHTYGFREFAEHVQDYTPARGEELTGAPAEKIILAARMFAASKPASLVYSASPVVHNTNGVQNYRAVFSLLALTGNYDVRGGNLAKSSSYLHVAAKFATREREFESPRPMSEMAPMIGADKFPVWAEIAGGEAQAMRLPDQLRSGRPYPLKALLGFGLNYRMWPASENFLESWNSLDFVINADVFMTDSCRRADLVLPVCTSLERAEFRAYPMGYAQLCQPVIAPLHQSRPDVDVIYDLAEKLCPDDPLFKKGYEESLNWILEPCGLTVEKLKNRPEGLYVDNLQETVERKYMEGAATPSGKIEFKSMILERYGEKPGLESLPAYHPPRLSREARPDLAAEYPFILNTGSRLPMFLHSRLNHLSWLRSLRPGHPAVDISPIDAERLGVKAGDALLLSTPAGSVKVKANPTRMALEGVAHLYHGWPQANANSLLAGDYLDPISGFPGYKSSLCSLKKATEGTEGTEG